MVNNMYDKTAVLYNNIFETELTKFEYCVCKEMIPVYNSYNVDPRATFARGKHSISGTFIPKDDVKMDMEYYICVYLDDGKIMKLSGVEILGYDKGKLAFVAKEVKMI